LLKSTNSKKRHSSNDEKSKDCILPKQDPSPLSTSTLDSASFVDKKTMLIAREEASVLSKRRAVSFTIEHVAE
jgi:hypothetical protein